MDVAKSVQIVFQTPELLIHILSFIEDEDTLRSVIRVSHDWFRWGIKELWHWPKPTDFSTIEKHRRQIYASVTTILYFDDNGDRAPDEIQDVLAGLVFPRLKEVSLIPSCYHDNIEQYLPPSLGHLTAHEAPITPGFLEKIASRCLHLRFLGVHMSDYGPSADTFVNFLRARPSICEVALLGNYGPQSVHDAILLYLASRDNLRSLSTSTSTSRRVLQNISETLPSPFQSLKELSVDVPPDAIPVLVKWAKSSQIRDLHIRCIGAISGYLDEFSHLTGLRAFDVDAHDVPSASEIASLKALTSLEEFGIKFDVGWEPLLDFTEKDFDNLFSRFPKLVRLDFCLPASLTGGALGILSKRCPLLETCILFDNAEGQKVGPDDVFPHLMELEVDRFAMSDGEDGDEFARRLRKQMPKLENLTYRPEHGEWDDKLYNTCVDLFDDMSGVRFEDLSSEVL